MRSETGGEPDSTRPRSIRSIVLLALVPLLLLGCSDGGAADLQDVADQFSAPDDWRLVGQSEVSETLCMGSGCDTVVIAWAAGEAPTADEFDALMQQAGWNSSGTTDCHVREDVTGPVPFCRRTAEVRGAEVELTAAGPIAGEEQPFLITLRVRG